MSKKQDKIPISKVSRASKVIGTSAKVGGNYLKYYTKKAFGKGSREELDKDNAKDIYDTLSQLKGSPLKVAQMLSMGEDILPKAYTDQFAMAQNSVPALSYPLIRKTFYANFNNYPEKIFDSFTKDAVKAASIGQVHQASLGDKKLAVKIQYPGVADSIASDLNIVKPLASKLLKVKAKEIEPYMKEVEAKLLEETNYELEIQHSIEISEDCKHLEGIVFPEYLRDYSSDRILTMTWLEGKSLSEWIATHPSQEERNKIGQKLWDFYQFQIHVLKKIHADPHPGNFIITDKLELGVIDFGCMKILPNKFYKSYVSLLDKTIYSDKKALKKLLKKMELITEDDSEKVSEMVLSLFAELFEMFGKPIYEKEFDFGDPKFFKDLFERGEELSQDKELKQNATRGSRHFIYFNRTYFGLYQLLHQLKANIRTEIPKEIGKSVA